jgi:hypothetical protein
MDPMGAIYSQGYAAHKAVTKPQSLIVVLGMWLWLLPSTIGTCVVLAVGLIYFVQDFRNMGFGAIIAATLTLSVVSGLFLVFGTILYKTTRSYLRLQRQQAHVAQQGQRSGEQQRSTTTDTTESETCLACGQSIAPDAVKCSKCGWSYEDG